MPSNVTVDFELARLRHQQAKTPEEKLDALMEMHRFAPSHKGGENLRRDISRKIAQARKDIEKQKKRDKQKGGGASLAVKKEGIGQVVLVGMPNSGKSWLLNRLTGVDVEIAPYPFTTKKPEIGMMDYRGAKIQLVELPAIVEGSSGGKANGPQLLSVARTADAIVLVAKSAEEREMLKKEMGNAHIMLNEKRPMIEISANKFGGIEIANKKNLKLPMQQIVNFFKDRGMHNASIVLNEQLKELHRLDLVMDNRIVYKKALAVNAFNESELQGISERIFSLLDKILIYTKKPGEKPEYETPLALPLDSTAEDVAKMLHKDIATKLKYARVWGSGKFGGQRVAKNSRLQNLDVVELYS